MFERILRHGVCVWGGGGTILVLWAPREHLNLHPNARHGHAIELLEAGILVLLLPGGVPLYAIVRGKAIDASFVLLTVVSESLKWLLEGAEQTWEKSFTLEGGGMQSLFDPIVLFVFTLVAAVAFSSSLMTRIPASSMG